MTYNYLPPPDHLKEHVRYYWTLEYDGDDNLPHTFAPLADGCPGLIYQQSDTNIFFDKEGKSLPAIFLYGQTIKPAQLCLMGRFRMIGVCFFPDALKSVFGLDASELTDTCTDLDPLAARLGYKLSERLLYTLTLPVQVSVLSAYLQGEIERNSRHADALTQHALRLIWQSGGAITLKELQQAVNLSERSFERKFNQYVGISPKLFSRVCRFQNSLEQLKRNDFGKLSDIAYDNGYSDQSHFIRVFREFAGYAPYEFRKRSYHMADNFPMLRQ